MFKENFEKGELIERIYWLIRLRWIAILGLFITTFVASNVFNVVTWSAPLYLIGIIIGITNIGFMLYIKILKSRQYAEAQKHAGIQIMTDLVSLTCLIYFAGGVENPFIFYFLFHVIIAGILLEKIYSYLQALFAICVFAVMILLEYFSIIPHQSLSILTGFTHGVEIWHSEEYILGIFFAFASTIFISVYFVTAIMDSLRKSRNDVLFEKQSTIDNMAEGVLFIDTNNKVTMCNKAIERTWKIKGEEITGKSINESLGRYIGATESILKWKFGKELETLQHYEVKLENRFLYNTYSPVYDNKGKYRGIVLTSHDITERKKLEQQLLHAERLATIGEMSAKVAHEIKNPLTSISLNTEMLNDEINSFNGGNKQEAEGLIQSIMKEIDRLTDISDEYLQFARFPKLKTTPVSINEILAELTRFLSKEISKRGITLLEDYGPNIPSTLLDRNQIKQAFLNFFKNSFDAMPDGGNLGVTTRCKGDNIEVCISDTGSGIAEMDVHKIFDPFHSTKANGTGLGLALTQKTIEDHGGEIFCRSSMDTGTTMTICFPVQQIKEETVG